MHKCDYGMGRRGPRSELGELGCPGQEEEEEEGEADQQLLPCIPAGCGDGSQDGAALGWIHHSVPPPRLAARFTL